MAEFSGRHAEGLSPSHAVARPAREKGHRQVAARRNSVRAAVFSVERDDIIMLVVIPPVLITYFRKYILFLSL